MIVSIIGNPGTGKSTLANDISKHSSLISRVRGDHYARAILPNQTPCQYAKGCRIDWELMNKHMNTPLGTVVTTPIFDYKTYSRISDDGDKPFTVSQIHVIDQVFPHPDADIIIYTHLPEYLRRIRRFKRDLVQGRGIKILDPFRLNNQVRIDQEDNFKYDLAIDTTRNRAPSAIQSRTFIMNHFNNAQ